MFLVSFTFSFFDESFSATCPWNHFLIWFPNFFFCVLFHAVNRYFKFWRVFYEMVFSNSRYGYLLCCGLSIPLYLMVPVGRNPFLFRAVYIWCPGKRRLSRWVSRRVNQNDREIHPVSKKPVRKQHSERVFLIDRFRSNCVFLPLIPDEVYQPCFGSSHL